MFGSKKATNPVLPRDAAAHLAAFGAHDRGGPMPPASTASFLASLGRIERDGNGAAAVRELHELAQVNGGWTGHGAAVAAGRFFPSQAGSADARGLETFLASGS